MNVRWGPDYDPAVHAVRGEVPNGSFSGTLPSALLQRTVHGMSMPEKLSLALALYHPQLWELHEQHVLYPQATQHPLSFHPTWKAQPWSSTHGTFRIAERLNLAKFHPAVWVNDAPKNPHKTGLQEMLEAQINGHWEPGIFIGDALLYLKDAKGPYALSWDIKSHAGEHGMPGGEAGDRMGKAAMEKAIARDAIYVEYMKELGIRVVRISRDDIPAEVAVSLFRLCRVHTQAVALPNSMIADLLGEYKASLVTAEPPRIIAMRYTRTDGEFLAAKNLLDIAIWQRRVRVDLYSPVLFDEPLVPEKRDVLEVLEHLFVR